MMKTTTTPIRCACLVAERDGRLLLVRVRQNEHWYLPGGKIEEGESEQDALCREISEELGITIRPATVRPLYTVTGPAYGQDRDVELICFAAEWDGKIRPSGEITDVQWLPWNEPERLAPAIRILCAEHFEGSPQS